MTDSAKYSPRLNRNLAQLREKIRSSYLADETQVVENLLAQYSLKKSQNRVISKQAASVVESIREQKNLGPMSSFLQEYSLTTQEGIALMCLAEALLRVPDEPTITTLIRDKITAGNWGQHLGQSSSSLVNASTWALMLSGRLLQDQKYKNVADTLRQVIQRLGEPVVRTAIAKGIRLVSNQFILGKTIAEAIHRSAKFSQRGYTYSYDMLGESALTSADAARYTQAYRTAILSLGAASNAGPIRDNHGISIKLSALHPRYEYRQKEHVIDELSATVLELALMAKDANIGLNIDAEEAERLEISLDVIQNVLSAPALRNWDGFGVVIQAYCRRALQFINWFHALAEHLDRKVMVRLVKGAYWDTEIKRAQVLGLRSFPVFTRKSSTDLSYLVCAQQLLKFSNRIYPQFATHNVHTICAVSRLAGDFKGYEFQRLHGMGEEVHAAVKQKFKHRCRIYAPVGAHEDLLAYLVRRILENGANNSFINQLMDRKIAISEIVRDPIKTTHRIRLAIPNPAIFNPSQLFGKSRLNSKGWDLSDPEQMSELGSYMKFFKNQKWLAAPTGLDARSDGETESIHNPANPNQEVGEVIQTPQHWIDAAIENAQKGYSSWRKRSTASRANILRRLADIYESSAPELISLMVLETGKTIADAISEIREAIDFCRYYAQQMRRLEQHCHTHHHARGAVVCISPWNFPLAIFTGQIAAAIAAGNAVIAKPAEQSPLTAAKAVELMHQTGIPKNVVQLLTGYGETVGSRLVADKRVAGVIFTGSTQVARAIHRDMAQQGNPMGVLVAETGGLNAMMIDSTALPEQAIQDIVTSAFQSAGQRCSALRILYVQQEIKHRIYDMLVGATEQLRIGDPWNFATDVGPVINLEAAGEIAQYCDQLKLEGKLIFEKQLPSQLTAGFVSPTIFEVTGIEDLEREIFGPVLHVATFKAEERTKVIDDINAKGYGLTFGLHSRVDQRVQEVVEQVQAGNIYINRNQIGAVVGSQPFGGTGMSGTGPKAGGPHYVARMRKFNSETNEMDSNLYLSLRSNVQQKLERLYLDQKKWARKEDRITAIKLIVQNHPHLVQTLADFEKLCVSPLDLEGPTGESNRLFLEPKGVIICIASEMHAMQALAAGNAVLAVAIDKKLVKLLQEIKAPIISSKHLPDSKSLRKSPRINAVAFFENRSTVLARMLRKELAARDGPIVQFITEVGAPWQFFEEKSLCIDTTAAGGNTKLLVESEV